jgi:regulator of RNase E activity RraA
MSEGEFERPSKEIIEAFRAIPTSTISAITGPMGINGIIDGLRPLVPGTRIAGIAFTIKATAADKGAFARSDFPLSSVIDTIGMNDVLVCALRGHRVSTMGGLGAIGMQQRGAAGMVIDGGVRDAEQITSIGFPSYVRHVCATSGMTRVKWMAINVPIEIDGAGICPGDIVVADDTSVTVVPAGKAEEILEKCQQREKLEAQFEEGLRNGETFAEMSRKLGIF